MIFRSLLIHIFRSIDPASLKALLSHSMHDRNRNFHKNSQHQRIYLKTVKSIQPFQQIIKGFSYDNKKIYKIGKKTPDLRAKIIPFRFLKIWVLGVSWCSSLLSFTLLKQSLTHSLRLKSRNTKTQSQPQMKFRWNEPQIPFA